MNENYIEILNNWNIAINELLSKSPSVFEVNKQYILKRYDNIEKIEKNIKAIQSLISLGIPAPEIIETNDKKLYIIVGENEYLLMKKLPGNKIKTIQEEKVAFNMGKVIGQLHIAFQKFDDTTSFKENDFLSELDGWVKNNFEKENWPYVKKEEFLEITDKIRAVNGEFPRQLIHRDVHFGNFLFLNGNLTGYIDFDLSQVNIRIFDICYFLAGLINDENHLYDSQFVEFVNETINGYETQILLSEIEKLNMPLIMEGIELLCTSYFLGIKNCQLAVKSFNSYIRIKNIESDILKLFK